MAKTRTRREKQRKTERERAKVKGEGEGPIQAVPETASAAAHRFRDVPGCPTTELDNRETSLDSNGSYPYISPIRLMTRLSIIIDPRSRPPFYRDVEIIYRNVRFRLSYHHGGHRSTVTGVASRR